MVAGGYMRGQRADAIFGIVVIHLQVHAHEALAGHLVLWQLPLPGIGKRANLVVIRIVATARQRRAAGRRHRHELREGSRRSWRPA